MARTMLLSSLPAEAIENHRPRCRNPGPAVVGEVEDLGAGSADDEGGQDSHLSSPDVWMGFMAMVGAGSRVVTGEAI